MSKRTTRKVNYPLKSHNCLTLRFAFKPPTEAILSMCWWPLAEWETGFQSQSCRGSETLGVNCLFGKGQGASPSRKLIRTSSTLSSCACVVRGRRVWGVLAEPGLAWAMLGRNKSLHEPTLIQAWQVLGRPPLIMPMDAGEGKIELPGMAWMHIT